MKLFIYILIKSLMYLSNTLTKIIINIIGIIIQYSYLQTLNTYYSLRDNFYIHSFFFPFARRKRWRNVRVFFNWESLRVAIQNKVPTLLLDIYNILCTYIVTIANQIGGKCQIATFEESEDNEKIYDFSLSNSLSTH